MNVYIYMKKLQDGLNVGRGPYESSTYNENMIKKNTVLRSQFTDYSLLKTLFYFIMFTLYLINIGHFTLVRLSTLLAFDTYKNIVVHSSMKS